MSRARQRFPTYHERCHVHNVIPKIQEDKETGSKPSKVHVNTTGSQVSQHPDYRQSTKNSKNYSKKSLQSQHYQNITHGTMRYPSKKGNNQRTDHYTRCQRKNS